jgi:formylglycine-generating enzyme required for sulfatase activity
MSGTERWLDVPGGEFLLGLTSEEVERLVEMNYEFHAWHFDPYSSHPTEQNEFHRRGMGRDFLRRFLIALCPPRSVHLEPFRLAHRPVTAGEFGEYCRSVGREWVPRSPDEYVAGLSWEDASAFAAWSGARLPTAAEWERTARGTSRRLFPWGSRWPQSNWIDSIALVEDNNAIYHEFHRSMEGVTHLTVEARRRRELDSPEGLIDLVTGRGEWCSDLYDPDVEAWALLTERPAAEFEPDWHVVMGTNAGGFLPTAALPYGRPDSPWAGFRLASSAGA